MHPRPFLIFLCLTASLCVASLASGAAPDRGPEVDAAVVERFRERNGAVFADWEQPKAVIVITENHRSYCKER